MRVGIVGRAATVHLPGSKLLLILVPFLGFGLAAAAARSTLFLFFVFAFIVITAAIPGQWKSGEAERSWSGELVRLSG